MVQTKSNSEYLIGFLDKVTRPLVLVMAKIRGYDKTLKVEDWDKNKNKNLMSFGIND